MFPQCCDGACCDDACCDGACCGGACCDDACCDGASCDDACCDDAYIPYIKGLSVQGMDQVGVLAVVYNALSRWLMVQC